MTAAALLALAERFSEFDVRLARIIDNPDRLSVAGQQTAISMLVALNLETISDAAAALRAIAATKP